MMQKGSGLSSSLVIISRRALILSVLCTALCSFALGYFFGYGGTTAGHVEADSKAAPSEERTVLDTSGKPTIVPPPPMPGIVPKEPPVAVRKDEQPAVSKREEGAKQEMELKDQRVAQADRSAGRPARDAVMSNQPQAPQKPQVEQAAPEKKPVVQSARTAKEKAVTKAHPARKPSGGRYALQAGAFTDKGKAVQLKERLSGKGQTVFFSQYEPEPGKTFIRVRVGPFATRQQALDRAGQLRKDGIETILVIASR
jgi:cell division septation protein DedD